MKAGVARFLWLWLPPLAIFVAGLWRAFLTGQADPWDWGAPMGLLLAGAGLMLARRGWATLTWVALGGVGMAMLFCVVASARAPDPVAAIGSVLLALLAVFGGSRLRPPSAPGILLLLVAALLLWRGPVQPLRPVAERPALAVITGLPLFWAEQGQGGLQDAPIVTVLRTRFTVVPLDDPAGIAASGARRLLLAQPRAMTPAQVMAIDRWVRDGGTALVLADPLLRWPSALPLGDRRRAPAASLIGSLLGHWGFQPAGAPHAAEIRHFLPDKGLLTVSGVQPYGNALPARRPVGRGEVLLLGDADLIDDRLWLADPAQPLDPRQWVADTPARVGRWLGAAMPGDRRWMRAAGDVRNGIRWALGFGTVWALLGGLLLGWPRPSLTPGTKSENSAKDARKNDLTHF